MTAAMSTCTGGEAASPCLPAAAGAPAPGWGEADIELVGVGLAAAGLAAALLVDAGPAEAGLAAAAPPKIDDMMFPNTDIFFTPDAQASVFSTAAFHRTVPEDRPTIDERADAVHRGDPRGRRWVAREAGHRHERPGAHGGPSATAAPAKAELCSSLGIVSSLAPARFGEHGARSRASGWVTCARVFSDAVVAGLVALGRVRLC